MPLDELGIPILTDVIQSGDSARLHKPSGDDTATDSATAEIIDTLLESRSFRQQMDEVAAELTRNARQRVEHALRPVIEQAIKQSLDNSKSETHGVIREQLQAAMPEIIAKTMRKESGKS